MVGSGRSSLRAVFAIGTFVAVVACKKSGFVDSDAHVPLPTFDAAARAEMATKQGPELYASLCAICHGDDGKGYRADHAPSLVSATFLESATDEFLRRSISEGRPGTAMAAYGAELGGPLDAAATSRLVAHLRSKGPAAKPLAVVGPGNAGRGGVAFAKSCEPCHGTKVTRGNAVHLANPKFLGMASDPFLRHAIEEGRPGTPMEPWKSKLGPSEIDDLVAYIRSYTTAPDVESLPPPTGTEPVVIHPTGPAPAFTLRADPCPPPANPVPADLLLGDPHGPKDAGPRAAKDAGIRVPPRPSPTPPPCKEDPRFVSVEQVRKALEEKRRMVIVDARPASDWMRVHIPDAVSIPYHDTKRLAEIPNDGTWVVAYCACPHHLSGDIVDELRRRGYKNAVVLDEGILEWHRRGYPVVAAKGVTPPPGEVKR